MEWLICAWQGRNIWRRLKIKYRINYDCVVIILTEQDEEWNKTALKYLPDYMKRKSAKKALVFYTENCTLQYSDVQNERTASTAIAPLLLPISFL